MGKLSVWCTWLLADSPASVPFPDSHLELCGSGNTDSTWLHVLFHILLCLLWALFYIHSWMLRLPRLAKLSKVWSTLPQPHLLQLCPRLSPFATFLFSLLTVSWVRWGGPNTSTKHLSELNMRRSWRSWTLFSKSLIFFSHRKNIPAKSD